MSLRETLNKNNAVGCSAALILVLVGLVALGFEILGGRRAPSDVSVHAIFTTDDQLTGDAAMQALFVDDVTRVLPFDHNGKPAYLAVVYVCNSGKIKWTSYLKRYTPEMRTRVQAAEDTAVSSGLKFGVNMSDFDIPGTEIKRPGPGP